MKHRKLHLPRLLIALTMGIAFLVMASVFAPLATEADDAPDARTMSSRSLADSTDPHEGLAELGSFEHRRYLVRVFATDGGPRFSIYEADGREIAALMSAERVAELFPELPLPTMDFSAPSQLMLLSDPDAAHR